MHSLARLFSTRWAGWSVSNCQVIDLNGAVAPGIQGFRSVFPVFADRGVDPDEFFARSLVPRTLEAAGARHIVYAGDAVASLTNPFGREVLVVRSPLTGLVIGTTTVPMVNPGDVICHVAKLEKTLATVERYCVTDSSGKKTLLVEGA